MAKKNLTYEELLAKEDADKAAYGSIEDEDDGDYDEPDDGDEESDEDDEDDDFSLEDEDDDEEYEDEESDESEDEDDGFVVEDCDDDDEDSDSDQTTTTTTVTNVQTPKVETPAPQKAVTATVESKPAEPVVTSESTKRTSEEVVNSGRSEGKVSNTGTSFLSMKLTADDAEYKESRKAGTKATPPASIYGGYYLLHYGTILAPKFIANSSEEEKREAVQVLSGNKEVIEKIACPQVIYCLLDNLRELGYASITTQKDGKKQSEPVKFFQLVQMCDHHFERATNQILAGIQRVPGMNILSTLEVSGEEIYDSLCKFDRKKKDESAEPRAIQELPKSVQNRQFTEEEKAAIQNDNEQAKALSKYFDNERDQLKEDAVIDNQVGQATQIDDLEDLDTNSYDADIQKAKNRSRINEVAKEIMGVYSVLFESCVALGKVFGVLTFATHDGKKVPAVIRATTDKDGKIRLSSDWDEQSNESPVVADWWSHISEEELLPVAGVRDDGVSNRPKSSRDAHKINAAPNREVPSILNILRYNYFPHFIMYYALGFVKGKRYTQWAPFKKALEADVRDRLYKISKYEFKMPDGTPTSGAEWLKNDIYREKIVQAFTTAAIVLSSDRGLENCQIRLGSHKSLVNYVGGNWQSRYREKLGNMEHTIKTLNPSGISVQDSIIDIQHYTDRSVFLSKPNWAFKTLGRVYGNGTRPDIKGEGVPIGLTQDNDMVYLKMGDNPQRFAIGIYAGSRSGKGVQTLATLCAAYGGGFGVCYVDYKPDMAAIYWEYENENPQIHAYAMDATASKEGRVDPNGRKHTAWDSLCKSGHTEYSGCTDVLLYAKHLQLLCLVADERMTRSQRTGETLQPMLWVFDEVTNITTAITSFIGEKYMATKPKLKKDPSEEDTAAYEKDSYDFKWKGASTGFFAKLEVALNGFGTKVAGLSSTNVIMIGQQPDKQYRSKGIMREMFKWLEQSCNKYIVGRGLTSTYEVGTVALNNSSDKVGMKNVENNRFFEMRDKAKANVSDTYDRVIFKPFFAVNTDNVEAPCWTTGIGMSYGFDATADNKEEMLTNYKANLHAELNDPEHPDDIVHRGTGFFGLLETYLGYIDDLQERQAKIIEVVNSGYQMVEESMRHMGLLGEGNTFGYESVEDFIYDLDPDKNFMTDAEIGAYIKNHRNDIYDEEEDTAGQDQTDGQETVIDSYEGMADFDEPNNDNSNETSDNNTQDQIKMHPPTTGYDDDYEEQTDTTPINEEHEDERLEDPYEETLKRTREDIRNAPKDKFIEHLERIARENHNGAVRQKEAHCRYNTIDDDGAARVDDDVYGSVLRQNLQMIDMKFNYDNKFLNTYGSPRHFRARQRELIRYIKHDPRLKNCINVSIGADDIVINGCSLGSCGYGGGAYFELLDGFDFSYFFSQFPNIRKLTLDSEAYRRVHQEDQLAGAALEHIIHAEPNLQWIEYPDPESGRTTRLTRDRLERANYVRKEEKRFKEYEEATWVLEESILLGGSGKEFKENAKNRSFARRVISMKNVNREAYRKAKSMLRATPQSFVRGLVADVKNLISLPFGFLGQTFRDAREGNF